MKKTLSLMFITMIMLCSYASARVQYDSNGNIIQDNTIRGRQRAAAAAAAQSSSTSSQRVRHAAAAKINYSDSSQTDWSKSHTYKTFTPSLNYKYTY